MPKPKPQKPPAGPIDSERLEGIEAIREAIEPGMSHATFYRKWRRYIEPILIERPDYWRYDPPKKRFFTFRRYLYALMMKHKTL